MARQPSNADGNNKLRSTTGRATHTPGSSQPSHAGLTNGTLCQQHLHNHSVGPWFDQCLTYPSHLFRLLLRRLRLPLPLPERSCRCRRVLDPLGAQLAHEQVFCEAELARWKEQPRESAGGWCPGHHKHSAHPPEPPEPHPVRQPANRSHANGLPIHQGAQLAVDATLVSPLTSSGVPLRHGGQCHGATLTEAPKRKERHTQNLSTQAGAA